MRNATLYVIYIVSLLCAISSVGYAQFSPDPIDGECGSYTSTTLDHFPVSSDHERKLCAKGEFDQRIRTNIDSTNPTQTQQFTRRCKGINGGSSATCHAQGNSHYYDNSLADECGSSAGGSFMTTDAPVGIAYTNFQNQFLGNLCQKTFNGQTMNVGPVSFNETALGWTWQCPTVSGNITCHAKRYQHANCGLSSDTGHLYTPQEQLCAPGMIESIITFDTDTHLRNRQCLGNGSANPAYCSAWVTQDDSEFQPSCNPLIVQGPNEISDDEYVSAFVGNDGCSIGELSYRSVYQGIGGEYKSTWKCATSEKQTSECFNVDMIYYENVQGLSCAQYSDKDSFDSASELFGYGLCEGGGVPKYFQELEDKRVWTCGNDSCEASKSLQMKYCGWAQHAPTKQYPTQGLCTAGEVDIMQDVAHVTGYQWKWSCVLPEERVECTSPRIIDGMCQRETIVDTHGFSTPQEVLDAGMCAEGIPEPLVPLQNTTVNKWTWDCQSPTAGGQNSQPCSAKVTLPNTIDVLYTPPEPAGDEMVLGPVQAFLTGFNPLYVDVVKPVGELYRVFATNTGFSFKIQDRAGNTKTIQAFVDRIDTSLPSAELVYTPPGYTTGNVEVTLTGFTSSTISYIDFTGSCLDMGVCEARISNYEPDKTRIIFTDNGEGHIILKDERGENTLPVVVTGIDRTPPDAHLEFTPLQPTSGTVTLSVINPTEPVSVVFSHSGTFATGDRYTGEEYLFAQNGEVTIQLQDRAGNTNYLTAGVDWIDRTLPLAEIVYSTTGTTYSSVVATLTNFSKTGTVILNNSGSNTYTFDHNHQFTFRIADSVGNVNEYTAKVSWIKTSILPDLLAQYQQNICHKFKKRLPVDIQGNEFNFHIITVIRNCLMKGYTLSNNHTYFYPRKDITRGEFITILGRFIRLIAQYEGRAVDDLSPHFIGVYEDGDFGPEVSEADALGLLFYTPITQSGMQKRINVQGAVSAKEANAMIGHALNLLGISSRTLSYIIPEAGTLTRGDVAYIFSNLIQNYEGVAIGNNLEFLKALHLAIHDFAPQEQRKFLTRLLYRLRQIPSSTFVRVGIDYEQLKSDLISIAQGTLPTKKQKVFIRVKTIMDDHLRGYYDPFNNAVFNDNQIYTETYIETDKKYEYHENIYTQ